MPVTTDTVWYQFPERLRRFVQKRVAEPGDADDILQDVFVKIHRRIGQLKDDRKLLAWIYQIARNAIVDHYRDRGGETEPSKALPVMPAGPTRSSDASREIARCLKPMIARLPPDYREAVSLAELGGMTQAELARRLNLSLSGAKSRVQRGRERIKTMLLDCCHFEFDRRGRVIEYRPKGAECPACLKGRLPK